MKDQTMDDQTPAHRHTAQIRSGDDHLIDEKSGELRNLDQELREQQAAPAAKPSPPKPAAAPAPDTSAQ